MIELLTGGGLKRVAIGLTVIMTVAWLVDLGIGIFAGNYFNIYHVLLPGYVPMRPLSRVAGTIYVAPWVANLHHYILWIIFVSLGGVLLLVAVRLLALKIAHAEDGD
jgi:hypothetical protein